MALEISDREFQAVIALPGPARYEHLIKRIADTEEIWSLRTEEGWVLAGDEGRDCLPVWPHARYAAACAIGTWSGSEPTLIALDDWLDDWLPRLESEHHGISGFPTPDGRTVIVEPMEMHAHLEEELSQYE
jgi:hypothetical protein